MDGFRKFCNKWTTFERNKTVHSQKGMNLSFKKRKILTFLNCAVGMDRIENGRIPGKRISGLGARSDAGMVLTLYGKSEHVPHA